MIKRTIYKSCIGLCLIWALSACNSTTPEKYISLTALNSNLVSTAYRPMFLQELMERKSNNQLVGTSVAVYIKDRALKPIEESIEKVQQLKETEETKELIVAALEVMTYGKRIFVQDYQLIAKLIDDGKPRSEIEQVITAMYQKTEAGMLARFNRLDSLSFAYARDNNVPFDVK